MVTPAAGADAAAGATAALSASDDVLCLRADGGPGACESARKLAFGHAICSCGDIIGTGMLSTRSLSSAGRANVAADSSLSLRIGRRGAVEDAPGEIDGSVDVAGFGPAAVSGSDARILGDLSLAGELTFAGNVRVTGSLYSRTLPRGSGSLQVDGDLHHAIERVPTALPGNVQVAGSVFEADYVSAPACACSAANLTELVSAIAAAESDNDDAREQLTSDSMSALTTAQSFSLSCGKYYFRSVSSLSAIDWQIEGHVVVFVPGDFAVRGELTVTLAPGAQLDLLIGGSLLLSSAARFAGPERPSAARVYVRGAVELAVGDASVLSPGTSQVDTLFVGNLYAPAASLQLAPHSEVYGSLFVRQLLVLQSLLVHYDPAVTSDQGASCEK
jgi:hypothetical protein